MKTNLKAIALAALTLAAHLFASAATPNSNASLKTGMYVSKDGNLNVFLENQYVKPTTVVFKDANGKVLFECISIGQNFRHMLPPEFFGQLHFFVFLLDGLPAIINSEFLDSFPGQLLDMEPVRYPSGFGKAMTSDPLHTASQIQRDFFYFLPKALREFFSIWITFSLSTPLTIATRVPFRPLPCLLVTTV